MPEQAKIAWNIYENSIDKNPNPKIQAAFISSLRRIC
jgi:hypothetical protein